MTAYGRRAIIQAIALVAGVVLVFWLFQEPVRELEAAVVARASNALGNGVVFNVGSNILIFPEGQAPIFAALQPSCSALASVLATVILFAMGRGRPAPRRARSASIAVGMIVAGNLLRLIAVVIVGTYGGRFALVAFHDFAGATFTFVYVIGSFTAGLAALLPSGDAVAGNDRTMAGRKELTHV
jgi:exosortase/archaeosortase family protein